MAGHRNLGSEWMGFKQRVTAPAANGILSVSDLTSIQGLKVYLASAEQTVVVKALLAALDTYIALPYLQEKWDTCEFADFTNWQTTLAGVESYAAAGVRYAIVISVGPDGEAMIWTPVNGAQIYGPESMPGVDYTKKMTLEAFCRPVSLGAQDTDGKFSVKIESGVGISGELANVGMGFVCKYNAVAGQWRFYGMTYDGLAVYREVEIADTNIFPDVWYKIRLEFRVVANTVRFTVTPEGGNQSGNYDIGNTLDVYVDGNFKIVSVDTSVGAAPFGSRVRQLRFGLQHQAE